MSSFLIKLQKQLTFVLFIIILNHNNNKSETNMKLIKKSKLYTCACLVLDAQNYIYNNNVLISIIYL